MFHELKQCLRQRGKLCLQEGVLYWCTDQAHQDGNDLQLVVPPDYMIEAMCRAHNDIGHLGIQRMLDILQDRFSWPNLETDMTHHVWTCKRCLCIKGKQDKEELYPLLATYPLELVQMDFLTIMNLCTGADVKVLVITDHFTWYAKAVVTPTQTAKATAIAFWNKFTSNYGIPEKLLNDQGHNFEYNLIKELCKLSNIQKVHTTPYHCTTNSPM